MARPLLLLHGYSASGLDFKELYWQLQDRNIDAKLVNVGNYVSLNNEITISDIAEGLDRAIRLSVGLKDTDEFDVIVHSTGMLVARAWLAHQKVVVGDNKRLKRLKHLIGLAPATWGSPQAHRGRTWLGALVKGNKIPGPDFLNAGDEVLAGLELGSKFTWDLAHADLLGEKPYFGTDSNTPYVAVFIGNTPYSGLSSLVNDPGTDGTVRWAGCGLNARKITLDLTETPTHSNGESRESRVTMSKWASGSRLNVPVLAIDSRDHGSLVANPDAGMVDRIVNFLGVADSDRYDEWLTEAEAWCEPARKKMLESKGHKFEFWDTKELDGWQQFVVHARDGHGDPVTDYMVEVFEKDEKGGEWKRAEELSVDVHAYTGNASFRCLHVQLPKGITTKPKPMQIHIRASTGTDVVTYQGFGSDEQRAEMRADSDSVVIDLTDALGDASLFHPFTTTLVEIILNRVPYPFDDFSKIFQWLPPFGDRLQNAPRHRPGIALSPQTAHNPNGL